MSPEPSSRRLIAVPDFRLMQRLLWVDLRDPAGRARLREDLTPAELEPSILLANARLFLRELGAAGVPATAKGNLSRAFVLTMNERMRFTEHESEWRAYTNVNKEDDVWPLHLLRVVLTVGGLVRKHRGRFVVTKKGAELAADERAGALQAHLFRTFFGAFNLSYLDRFDDSTFQSTVAYALHMLRQIGDGWRTPKELRRAAQLGLAFMAETDEERDRDRQWVFERRLLRPLETFGLMETRVSPSPENAGRWSRDFEVRKTPLFDTFIAFDLSEAEAEPPVAEAEEKRAAGRKARTVPKSSATVVYQLKVSLKGAKPPIWRRLLVGDDVTLRRLHNILQAACGWSNSHLHEFSVGGNRFGRTDPEWPSDMRSDTRKRLSSLGLVEGDKLEYVYDFGDWWEHTILVEAIRPRKEDEVLPLCTAGRRAFPPEDCGGTWGYQELLAVLADSSHPEHEHMSEWVGPYFDPEAVDLAQINSELVLVGKGHEPGIGRD
ncbi:MAG: plasmid pRiA4b ORF-3 family protein [Thermoleophilia bacterium]